MSAGSDTGSVMMGGNANLGADRAWSSGGCAEAGSAAVTGASDPAAAAAAAAVVTGVGPSKDEASSGWVSKLDSQGCGDSQTGADSQGISSRGCAGVAAEG